jgi:Tfp pilus tip-associated adhesin PilY1
MSKIRAVRAHPVGTAAPARPARPARGPALVAALAVFCLLPRCARADDRDLVVSKQKTPYVFIILDVSGSMHQTVTCDPNNPPNTQCPQACTDPNCPTEVCVAGNCLPHLSGDDPFSKVNTAKQAIYGLMQARPAVNFGFASFDQGQLRYLYKHWWYQAAASQPQGFIQLDTHPVGVPARNYPDAGEQEVFGQQAWNCTDARKDNTGAASDPVPLRWVSCPVVAGGQPGGIPVPALLSDPWQWERARRYPKLNDDLSRPTVYYIQEAAGLPVYKVTFSNDAAAIGQKLGDPSLSVIVRVDRCTNASCNTTSNIGNKKMTYLKQSEFIYWEPGEGVSEAPTDSNGGGAFFGNVARMVTTSGNQGLDTNGDDTSHDGACSSNGGSCNGCGGTCIDARWPTSPDPFGRTPAIFQLGDFTPLDWKDNHQALIQKVMAPNLLDATQTVPSFAIAPYLNDHRQGGDAILRLKVSAQRPLAPDGGTPTGAAMQNFYDWLNPGGSNPAPSNGNPNSFLAAASNSSTGDPAFACRPMYTLLITDGFASDGTRACTVATTLASIKYPDALTSYPVRSYVIGMGLKPGDLPPNRTDTLDCVADNGGTGSLHLFNASKPDGPGPLLPTNEAQLVKALTDILTLVQAQQTSVAAVAVPSVQADVQDKVVLTSFLPVNDRPIWPGTIDTYLKPVPLQTGNSLPDRTHACTTTGQIACHVWNAGGQTAATPDVMLAQAQAGPPDTSGTDPTKRRLFYARNLSSLPNERLYFQWPAADVTHRTDLEAAMGICAAGDDTCSGLAANQALAQQTVTFTAKVKQYTDPTDPTGNTKVNYILGDIFHSDPQVLGNPSNFAYFAGNVDGYQTFAAALRFRRKVLFAGSNDGELHAFDIGTVHQGIENGAPAWQFNNGTGNELFAYIPRPVMPTLKAQGIEDANLGGGQKFMVDGTPVLADVFIKAGTSLPQWHSIVLGGLREGGSGYYALDVTQPDALTVNGNVPGQSSPQILIPDPNASTYLPGCFNGGCGIPPFPPATGASTPSLPYPAPLWEFYDLCNNTACSTGPCPLIPCDEDTAGPGKGHPDLGQTWSVANAGRIRVCPSGMASCTTAQAIEKFVAVFGGGMDPTGAQSQGNYLYMVDIETGLVIYKQPLDGSAPSEPAAVNTNLDGFIDKIYIGTTNGFLYKVDLSNPAAFVSATPAQLGPRIDPTTATPSWVPFKIFDTRDTGVPNSVRPIYYPPSVLFITQLGRFALAFGTGNRQDLWTSTGVTGRFYVIVDNGLAPGGATTLPLTSANLTQINPGTGIPGSGGTTGDGPFSGNTDLLITPPTGKQGGFFLELDKEERVVNKSFALGGVTIFSSFQPQSALTKSGSNTLCANTGNTRIFAIQTNNGNAIFENNYRYEVSTGVLGGPIVAEQGQTKNRPPKPGDAPLPPNLDTLTTHLKNVQAQLQKLFPPSCRFANFTINIKASRSDTGVDFIAPVPICMIEKNWKEN